MWREALNTGVYRDGGDEQLVRLQQVNVTSVYYGDLTNAVPSETQKSFDAALDLADRRNSLADLGTLTKTKQFRRSGYEALPGRSSVKEFFADIGAPILSTLARIRHRYASWSRNEPDLVKSSALMIISSCRHGLRAPIAA